MRYGKQTLTNDQWSAIAETKEAVNAAFKDLRKQGLITKQNFMCCGSCASYDIWSRIHELAAGFKEVSWDEPCQPTRDNGWKRTRKEFGYEETKAKQYRGAVYYSRQGNDVWTEGGTLFLSYGGVAETDEDTEEVGRMIEAALKAHGLKVRWNGSHSETIMVDVEIGTDPEKRFDRMFGIRRKQLIHKVNQLEIKDLIAMGIEANIVPASYEHPEGVPYFVHDRQFDEDDPRRVPNIRLNLVGLWLDDEIGAILRESQTL